MYIENVAIKTNKNACCCESIENFSIQFIALNMLITGLANKNVNIAILNINKYIL